MPFELSRVRHVAIEQLLRAGMEPPSENRRVDTRDQWHLTDDLHAEAGKGDPFAGAVRATRMPMIITDPRQADNPIVFANDAFIELTGYTREEIHGKNCRFLQGPESDPGAIAEIRIAISEQRDVSVDLLNYRKDGSTFWNALFISPVTTESGELQFYFASQFDVTERKNVAERIAFEKNRFEQAVRARTRDLEEAIKAKDVLLHEVDHRVKNNLQMISSLIVMQSRAIDDEKIKRSLRAMLERIEALGTVHRRLYQSKDVSTFDVGDFARDLVTDLLAASGRPQIKADYDLDAIVISAEKATPVALMLNELVTNALKHAYGDMDNGAATGRLGVKLKKTTNGFSIEVSDDGCGMPSTGESASFGMRLIKSLARQLHADITWSQLSPGTRVTINLPDPEMDGVSL